MDSTKSTYATFPFEWTVKSTSYQIQYRKAFNINEIDEIFCSIINAKGNEINFSELGVLLGFNLQDLAETDIFKIYLKGLTEYNLIVVNEKEQKIQLTKFGQEALQTKLKYKYYFATTELFENQTASGENFDFSFKTVFDIDNSLFHIRELKEHTLENPEVKQKLQFQLFGNDIYKGEIVELYKSEPRFNYKNISLHSEIKALDDSFQLSIFKSGVNKPEVQLLIELPENTEFKNKLLRKGMYHHILSMKELISKKVIETYIDLWNWKELANNPKLDWNDKTIFELFRENGDVGIWSIISEKAPIPSIKSVIEKYAEYWDWNKLTKKIDDEFIKGHIDAFNWDFEELSYRESGFIQEILLIRRKQHLYFWNNEFEEGSKCYKIINDLAESKGYEIESLIDNRKNELIEILTLQSFRDEGWDWNYLSKNLPNDFIEKHIDDFSWDFYLITEIKGDILRNLFKNQGKSNYTNILLSKPWNWKFISKEFKDYFLYEQIHFIASKVDWHIVLERFFTSEEITTKCLKEESFKTLLKQHLPESFVIAHQRYLWTLALIDFFENLNLIQWETQKYIIGYDTNENVEWSKYIFQKYHKRITTEIGFLNVSTQISDYSVINDFPDFAWNWEGISQNRKLISNATFIEKAFVGELSYSNNLLWNEILSQSTFEVSFWNKNLEAFYKSTESEKQIEFWRTLTQKERTGFVFENKHFPWDWRFITEKSSKETILNSYKDDELFEKWDWKISTRKIDKETILKNLDILTKFIDWEYTINEIFNNEFVFDNSNLKIAYRLSQLKSERQIAIWKTLTAKYPFEKIFPLIEKTFDFDVWKWDWEYISSHPHLPNDFKTLNQIKHKIIWVKFSDNESIKRKFEYNKSEWTYKEYFKYILKYLNVYQNFWDWKVLTQNSHLHYNREFIKIFQDKWDWDYLSGKGGFLLQKKRDNENYLLTLLLEFQQIHFPILSQRKDIEIKSDLILETKDRGWDWQVLSENEKADISNELILKLKDKNWNWQALSKRKYTELSNETLLQLLDKDWDWSYLSENNNLEFNAEFIEKTKVKSWNWKLVSRHKSFSPSVEILTLTKDYDLDWQYISKHLSLSPTTEILAKFENKWHWQSITENPQINFDDIDFLERFANKWNWRIICESGKLLLNSQVLKQFKEHLEWDLISSNNNINFTKEIIQEFYELWYWNNLKNNKRIEDLNLLDLINDFINNDPILYFIVKISEQKSKWNNCVFHFTNIDNAVKIINDKKIKSRKSASQISNSSGILTYHTRKDPEKFARFYFRTETPTQYYNEGLFKSIHDDRYRNLGYPKCPIMIYFKASLQEILFKNRKLNNIYLSDGNMQRNETKYGQLTDMIKFFNYDGLFNNNNPEENSKGYSSQQELMFLNEVSLLDLSSLEIIFEKEDDMLLFKRMTGGNNNDFKIKVDNSIYDSKNDKVFIGFTEDEVQISSNYNQQGYFKIIFDNFIPNVASGEIIKIDKVNNTIYFNRKLLFPITFQDFKLYFVVEIENYKQEWILGTQKEFKYKNEHKIYQQQYFQF